MAPISTAQRWVRRFFVLLLLVQGAVFAACAAGYFERPDFAAVLMITLIFNLCICAFQYFGRYAWELEGEDCGGQLKDRDSLDTSR